MLYHCNYLIYAGLLYIGSYVTSDFSDIPQRLIFLGYTVFGKIMAISQRLQCVQAQGAHSSEQREDCKCNWIALVPGDAVETCKFCNLFGFAKDKVSLSVIILDKSGQSLPVSVIHAAGRKYCNCHMRASLWHLGQSALS
jgi:hypothetical protein